MVLTLTSTLALFVLIALSTVVFFASKRFKLPYTVLLVLVGLLLVPIVNLPYLRTVFGFIGEMVLTPELLFFIFLPVLIFESGFNMNIRKMVDNAWAISLLAVVALTISAVLIGTLLYYVLPLIGINVPFILTLMFGAIISATDPVAVLSLFKEFKVPRRLGMLFEGESLLNDGTAVALFFVFFAIATDGFYGSSTILHGISEFVVMLVSGVLIGLLMASLFSRAVHFTKHNEFVTVTLLVISAHLVFIITELINSLGYFHVSSIIATTAASLFLGNYSRNILAPKIDEYLSKLIEHMAFVVNSLVFLMAGLLFASSGVNFTELWLPIAITVLIVAFTRFVAVYAVIVPLNLSKAEDNIPASWRKLLAWASLRGALSIIIILVIPEDFTLDGWSLPYTPRDFLLALTIGCILATLFIKAPLIGPIMRRYNINATEPLETAHRADLGIYYLLMERSRLQEHKTKGFFNEKQYQQLQAQVEYKLSEAETERQQLIQQHGRTIFVQSLYLAMSHIEMSILKRLFINNEISVRPYRRIHSKLCLQQEKIEYAQHNNIDPEACYDRKDIFDKLANTMHNIFSRKRSENELLEEQLQYYRTQMIMARKAVIIIDLMQNKFDTPVFQQSIYDEVTALYRHYKEKNAQKLQALLDQHPETLLPHLENLANRSLVASGERALTYLHENGLVNEAFEEDIRHRFAISNHHK
ncbi:sodium:proton antiporter [Chromatiaceae bacterium AAb-1]|nr:sodium:proton antiporter [Chromatiaceae bacterium AAb-1]